MQDIRIAAISSHSKFGDTCANLANILGCIDDAAAAKAALVCFAELALQGYGADRQRMRDLAEPADGPSCRAIHDRARRHNLIVSFGMSLAVDEKVYNSNVLIGPDGVLGVSHKIHTSGTDALFDQANDWPVFDIGKCKLGVLICRDACLPESARILALKGAEVVIICFASGRLDCRGQLQDPLLWSEQVLRWTPARAFDNGLYVVGVNQAGDISDPDGIAEARCADEHGLHRWPGYSFAIAPDGSILAESDRTHNRQRMLVVDLSVVLRQQSRSRFLYERRPDTYGDLVSTELPPHTRTPK